MASTSTSRPIPPSSDESDLARTSSRALAKFLDGNLRVNVAGSDETIELPAIAVRLLVDLLSALSRGNAVSIIPIHAELTTQEAANLIGVSRPFLIKQLEEKKIEFRMVGTHRRILFSNLMQYKEEADSARQMVLDELANEARDLEIE